MRYASSRHPLYWDCPFTSATLSDFWSVGILCKVVKLDIVTQRPTHSTKYRTSLLWNACLKDEAGRNSCTASCNAIYRVWFVRLFEFNVFAYHTIGVSKSLSCSDSARYVSLCSTLHHPHLLAKSYQDDASTSQEIGATTLQ